MTQQPMSMRRVNVSQKQALTIRHNRTYAKQGCIYLKRAYVTAYDAHEEKEKIGRKGERERTHLLIFAQLIRSWQRAFKKCCLLWELPIEAN